MAILSNDLYSETERLGLPAIQPDRGPGAVVTRTFTAVAGSPTLALGTPVYVVTATGHLSKAVPTATSGESLDIFGFVWPKPIQLDATDTAIGSIMAKGSIDFNHLEALRDGSYTGSAEIAGTAIELRDICRKPALHDRGLHIDNLSKIGGADALGA